MPSQGGGLYNADQQSPVKMAAIYDKLASGSASANGGETLSGNFLGFSSGSAGPSGALGDPHGALHFAGQGGLTTESVIATQTAQPGGVTLHFTDGSSLNVVGATHIDHSFFKG